MLDEEAAEEQRVALILSSLISWFASANQLSKGDTWHERLAWLNPSFNLQEAATATPTLLAALLRRSGLLRAAQICLEVGDVTAT